MGDDKFKEWMDSQKEYIEIWKYKLLTKTRSASKVKLKNYLTLEQYMYKAFEAGINHPDQIGITGFHLSRINDTGDYTYESCRFLPYKENLAERKDSNSTRDQSHMYGNTWGANNTWKQGEKHHSTSLTNEQVIKIFYDNRLTRIIAEEYGVTSTVIRRIKTKERWSSVTKDLK